MHRPQAEVPTQHRQTDAGCSRCSEREECPERQCVFHSATRGRDDDDANNRSGKRGIPDVAYDANPSTGVRVCLMKLENFSRRSGL